MEEQSTTSVTPTSEVASPGHSSQIIKPISNTPVGLRVIAGLMILSFILGIAGSASLLKESSNIWAIVLLLIIVAPVLIAIGLLKRIEIVRKATIIVSILLLVSIVPSIPVGIVMAAGRGSSGMLILLFSLLLSVAFYSFTIYYLTREHVREIFKQ